eukprot:2799064-Rhodomonas_salina.1
MPRAERAATLPVRVRRPAGGERACDAGGGLARGGDRVRRGQTDGRRQSEGGGEPERELEQRGDGGVRGAVAAGC